MKIGVRIHIFQGHELFLPSFPLDSTIFSLKSAICSLKGFSVEQIQLTLPKSHHNLPDSLPLKNIPNILTKSLASFNLKQYNRLISLRIIRPERDRSYLSLKVYPCCLVSKLKETIQSHTQIRVMDQTLTYNGTILSDEKLLMDYGLKDTVEDLMNLSSIEESNVTTTSRPYEIFLNVRKLLPPKLGKLSLGIDFSFNSIKNVKKSGWKPTAPWYREVTDGLSWICYCRNEECAIYNQVFITNRGFGHFYLHAEMKHIICPVCRGRKADLRNIGFVNCQWQYKGSLSGKKDSRTTGDGRTYDNKFYTFKEADYGKVWDGLELLVKHLEGKPLVVVGKSDPQSESESGDESAYDDDNNGNNNNNEKVGKGKQELAVKNQSNGGKEGCNVL